MIKHIVQFQIAPMGSDEEKKAKLQEIKNGLDALLGVVPSLRSMEVGINMNSANSYDLVLTALFDTMDDLEAYVVHPAHVAVGKIIGAVKTGRTCVDYIV